MDLIVDQRVYNQNGSLFSRNNSCRQKSKRRPAVSPAWRIKQNPAYIPRSRFRGPSFLARLCSLFDRFTARPGSRNLNFPKRGKSAKGARPAPAVQAAPSVRPGPLQAAAGFKDSPAQAKRKAPAAGFPKTLRGILKSLPLPAFLTAVFSLCVFFAVLDWESPSLVMLFRGPGLLEPGPVKPAEDGQSEQNLASYVGFGLSSSREGEEEIPLDLMETFSWESYRVRRGDTVSGIAADRHISIDAIIASNGIANVKRLREGETLRLPNMDGIPYTVKKGDSVTKISGAMGVPMEAILDANDIQDDTIAQGTVLFIPGARMKREELKLAMGDLFVYPIRGRLTSSFGWRNDPISGVRRHHAAIDLAAPMGTPIKAAQDGKVSVVGVNLTYGRFVILEHGGGYQTMYAHMSVVSVKQGTSVIQGSKIGEVGSTGYSTGPHLHFAVYKNGKAVNPLEFLNQ
ncbi:MAG: M23 family metallopeptidase [Treponema sp.]|jgi:murein DD-endopeptidase MepM/ murein hydrolase activator NlpD|nr:M23 family metallopeptidase [Treponema sp.]